MADPISLPQPTPTLPSSSAFLSFEAAKIYVDNLCLGDTEEKWDEYCKSGKRPSNIPSDPATVYQDAGWVSWSDWLVTIDPEQDSGWL